jgi:hypothetical protein
MIKQTAAHVVYNEIMMGIQDSDDEVSNMDKGQW